MQDEKSSKEAPFIMNTKWITKEKIIASPEEHGELEWILLANSTRLSMDTRRYPSGISPFGSMLHWKSFLCIQRQFFSKQRAWNLFTHNIVNVISAAAFLASSTGNFLCLHSLNFDFLFVCFFFHNSFLERTVLSDFSSFWHSVVTIMSSSHLEST